jgi:hypothetical protein
VGFAVAQDGQPPDIDIEGVLGPRVSALPVPVPTVHLVWVDPAGVAIVADGLARDETTSLLGSMGIPVSWRRGAGGEPARPGEVLVVLVDRVALDLHGRRILGARPSRVDVAPLVWVHVPSVRAVIGLRPDDFPTGDDPVSARKLAIALGRVIAHEVVHALAPAIPHGRGLMSAVLTGRQLTAAALPGDPEVALGVRAAWRGLPSPGPAAAGVVGAAVTRGDP